MEFIEGLVMRRQALKDQIAELSDEIKTIDNDIIVECGNESFKGSREVAGYLVSVTTKRTFKPAIAEKLLAEAKVPAALKKSLYVQTLDSKKVKALLPDLYEDAQVEGAEYVTVREAN